MQALASLQLHCQYLHLSQPQSSLLQLSAVRLRQHRPRELRKTLQVGPENGSKSWLVMECLRTCVCAHQIWMLLAQDVAPVCSSQSLA